MRKFSVMVWEDYHITNTYWVDVDAETEEEAMGNAIEVVKSGQGGDPVRSKPMDLRYEANDNIVEIGVLSRPQVVQIASEMADTAVRNRAKLEGFEVDEEDEGELYYTEKAQEVFNGYYDTYDHLIGRYLMYNPKATAEDVRNSILYSGKEDEPPTKQ